MSTILWIGGLLLAFNLGALFGFILAAIFQSNHERQRS